MFEAVYFSFAVAYGIVFTFVEAAGPRETTFEDAFSVWLLAFVWPLTVTLLAVAAKRSKDSYSYE